MKTWKKYLTGVLALALVVGMVSLLPHIHGEEFGEDEYTFSEEETLESGIDGMNSEVESESEQDELPIVESDEPMESDEPLESDMPIESELALDGELDGEIEDVEDTNMQPAKLELIPRELTESEQDESVKLEIWWCECDYTITNAEGKTCRIIDEEPSGGNMEAELYAWYCGFSLRKYIIEPSSYYMFSGDFGNGEIMLSWDNNTFVTFKCNSGVESFVITKDGISVQGANMDCEISRVVTTTTGADCHRTMLNTTNSNRVVLLYEDEADVFKGWADGVYSFRVVDVTNLNRALSIVTAPANSVYCISNAGTSSPMCQCIDEAE